MRGWCYDSILFSVAATKPDRIVHDVYMLTCACVSVLSVGVCEFAHGLLFSICTHYTRGANVRLCANILAVNI